MVIKYLEKIRDSFLEDKVYIQKQLLDATTMHKENVAFIKLLEQNNDSSFEAFTPRTVNSFHKKKIEELKEKQKILEMNIIELENKQNDIDKEIEEVTEVIKVAKKMMV